MMDLIQKCSLNYDDFNKPVEYFIDKFLAKRMITMFYAAGGSGKSWLGVALAKHCATETKSMVYYLDFDNPMSVLQERSIHKNIVGQYSNLHYIHRSKSTIRASELLSILHENAVGRAFDDHVFIFDSLRNFSEVNNEGRVMQTMNILMDLREAGATVILLHHANKDGKNYQGSNNIYNSVDNIFELKKMMVADGVGTLLEVVKERCSINDVAFDISPLNYALTTKNTNDAKLTQEESIFVNDTRKAIKTCDLPNKTSVLCAIGHSKDDKAARSRLDKFDGIYWRSQKERGQFLYQIIN